MQNKGFILFSMRGSRGTGVQNPPPPPSKIIKLPSLHSMLEHHRSASETPFKWRFAFCGIWIHSTHQLKKKRCQSWCFSVKVSSRGQRFHVQNFSAFHCLLLDNSSHLRQVFRHPVSRSLREAKVHHYI